MSRLYFGGMFIKAFNPAGLVARPQVYDVDGHRELRDQPWVPVTRPQFQAEERGKRDILAHVEPPAEYFELTDPGAACRRASPSFSP